MSFVELASNPKSNIISNLKKKGIIKKKVVSIFLTKEKDTSRIVFGGIDYSLVDGKKDFVYAKIIGEDYYEIKVNALEVFGKSIEVGSGLVDSGTSCFTIPQFIMKSVLELLSENKINYKLARESYAPSYSMLHCYVNATTEEEIVKQFPVIGIQLEAEMLYLNPQDYIYSTTIAVSFLRVHRLRHLE